MTLHISITAETEASLRCRAAARGIELSTYLEQLVSRLAEPPLSLESLSGPVFEAFQGSGMTDDQLGDLLEESKHELRSRPRVDRAS